MPRIHAAGGSEISRRRFDAAFIFAGRSRRLLSMRRVATQRFYFSSVRRRFDAAAAPFLRACRAGARALCGAILLGWALSFACPML